MKKLFFAFLLILVVSFPLVASESLHIDPNDVIYQVQIQFFEFHGDLAKQLMADHNGNNFICSPDRTKCAILLPENTTSSVDHGIVMLIGVSGASAAKIWKDTGKTLFFVKEQSVLVRLILPKEINI